MALPRPYDPNDPYAQQPMRAPMPYAPMPGSGAFDGDGAPPGLRRAVLPDMQPAPMAVEPPTEQMPPAPPIRGAASPADVGSDEKARLQSTLDDPAFGDYVTANQKPDKGWEIFDAIASGLQGKQHDSGYWQGRAKQFDEANLKDPHSEESHKLRQANAPMLQQLGLQPDEIAHLSGADIANVSKGGNLVEGLLTARQKAQLEMKKRDQELADAAAVHTQKLADEEAKTTEQRAYEETQAAGPKFERQKELARLGAGLGESRAIESAVLGDRLQRGRTEDEAAAAAARKRDEEARAAEAKGAGELVALDEIEKRLEARAKADPNGILPGSEGYVQGKVIEGQKALGGGTGRGSEESKLNTDLTALGLQAYMQKAGNAPNSVAEQAVANQLFRGNGTNQSALERIRERKAEIKAVQGKRVEALGAPPKPAPAGGGKVHMRDPRTGKEAYVPADKVETAKANGAEVVGG